MLNLVRDLRQITLCLQFRAKILSIAKSKKDSFLGMLRLSPLTMDTCRTNR